MCILTLTDTVVSEEMFNEYGLTQSVYKQTVNNCPQELLTNKLASLKKSNGKVRSFVFGRVNKELTLCYFCLFINFR